MIPRLSELPAPPRRVILHWTAGGKNPNPTDFAAYHYLVAQSGEVHPGKHGVEANMRKVGPDRPYAMHTRALNSFSVGVSLCGMAGAREGGPFGPHPITEEQTRAACAFVGELCKAWALPVSENTVFTHWEAQSLHGVKQSGKWDISVFPWNVTISAKEIGPILREWVRESMRPRIERVEPDRPPLQVTGRPVPPPTRARSSRAD
jgi:N-acetyl-anhydromuramyl-L-alanine amidase AmpD